MLQNNFKKLLVAAFWKKYIKKPKKKKYNSQRFIKNRNIQAPRPSDFKSVALITVISPLTMQDEQHLAARRTWASTSIINDAALPEYENQNNMFD